MASDFNHPILVPSVDLLRDHFSSDVAKEMRPLRNPHHELKVSETVKETARAAAVLLPIIQWKNGLTLLVTRRHRNIRFAGHICFPGGGCEDSDATIEQAALREAHEEIDLRSDRVEIIGRLGDYYTQTGYRISPVVGIVTPPLGLTAHPDEVEEIIEIPFGKVLRSDSYQLTGHSNERAHFSLTHDGVRVAGPTVAIMMGLYEELLRSRRTDTR
jgi:8-oxo-dGTP pyrophosphatase MutT (NUDIX family)|tara:strand:+ start:1139 stop:1783 length:645 start_codon:yes stop_codon:yes gene_type:complete